LKDKKPKNLFVSQKEFVGRKPEFPCVGDFEVAFLGKQAFKEQKKPIGCHKISRDFGRYVMDAIFAPLSGNMTIR
jgi:hypothetical protein